MENNENEMLQCVMCFFKCISHSRLMSHYIRYHKQNPHFRVTCVQPGCGATFKKWKSFRQHLFRKHPAVPPILDEVAQQVEGENQLNQENENQLLQEEIMLYDESCESKKCILDFSF